MGHFVTFVFLKIEEKFFFRKKFQKFQVLCLWVHILGVPVRAQKLQDVLYNIFRSHQNRSSGTKVMKNQKLGPI